MKSLSLPATAPLIVSNGVEASFFDLLFYIGRVASCVLRYPFISIYFRQLGFSAPQIGFLFAIRPWITALTGTHPEICQWHGSGMLH